MKKIAEKDVMKALQDYVSLEEGRYYLHITEAGEIVDGLTKEKEGMSFSTPVDMDYIAEHFDTEDDWRDDFEKESDPHFMEIVKTLTDEANAWLA